MRPLYTFITLLLVLLLSACSKQDAYDKVINKDKDKFAKAFIQQVLTANTNMSVMLDSSLHSAENITTINRFEQIISNDKVGQPKIIGYTHNVTTKIVGDDGVSDTYWQFIYEYPVGKRYSIFIVTVEEQNGQDKVVGFHANMYNSSWESRSTLNFKDKSAVHYIMFAMWILVFVFVVISFIKMLTTDFKKKWLWGIFILMCNLSILFNWSVGIASFKGFLSFSFLGTGYSSGTIDTPIALTTSIPIGAIIFWLTYIRRRRFEKRAELFEQEYGLHNYMKIVKLTIDINELDLFKKALEDHNKYSAEKLTLLTEVVSDNSAEVEVGIPNDERLGDLYSLGMTLGVYVKINRSNNR